MPEEINPADLEIADELIAERRGAPGKMPDDMPRWMAAAITRIDAFSHWIGRMVCWLLLPLCVAMVYEVIARKYFLAPRGMDTAWMPYMGPVKSALPVGALLLLIQGVSETLKSLYAARHNRWA